MTKTMNNLINLIETSSQYNDPVTRMKHWRRGAKWVLEMLDFEMSDPGTSKETKEFISDFITKYENF